MPFSNPITRERLLAGSPLRRRGTAIVAASLVGGLLAAALAIFALVLKDWNAEAFGVFLGSLLTASLLSLVPAFFLRWLDRRERESGWLLLFAFLWGGLIAAGLSMELNDRLASALLSGFDLAPDLPKGSAEGEALVSGLLAAPLVEELLKALGIALLFWGLRAEYDNLRDGLIYGAMVGLGFTWIETSLYVVGTGLELGPKAWAMQVGWRYALFGLGGHALYSGLFGAGLGLSRQTGRTWLRWLAPPSGLVLALAAHVLDNLWSIYLGTLDIDPGRWNVLTFWLAGSLWQLVFLLPFLLILLCLLWRSGIAEREIIEQELALESDDLVTPADRSAIAADGLFKTRRIASENPTLSARLVNAQNELAFRRRYLRRRGENPDEDGLVLGWREDIEALRAELAERSQTNAAEGPSERGANIPEKS